jgi:hypothetical protein
MSIRRSAGLPDPTDDRSWASLSSAAAWAGNQKQNTNIIPTMFTDILRLFHFRFQKKLFLLTSTIQEIDTTALTTPVM